MPSDSIGYDRHVWQTNEEIDAPLLNQNTVRIGEGRLSSDSTGITGVHTVAKANVVNYGDSRELLILVYGSLTGTGADIITARIVFGGSEADNWQVIPTANFLRTPCCFFTTVFPGAAGAASCYVTLERASTPGNGPVTAWAPWRIVILDIGPSSGVVDT